MSLGSVLISSVMIRDVKTIRETESLQQACKLMQIHNIGSVIVVGTDKASGDVPVGIITEKDVVNNIAVDPTHSNFSARESMSHPLVGIDPSASLKDALVLMVSKDIRRLPVVDNGRLVGIVTDKDIYRTIARSESLITALVSDEILTKHLSELEQPLIYKLGEILHRRLDNGIANSVDDKS